MMQESHSGSLTTLTRFKRYLLLAILISIVFSTTTFFRRTDLGLQDLQMVRLATPIKFERTVVIDVDEDSMATLAESLGAWPYDREVFSLVVRYLNERRVSNVR